MTSPESEEVERLIDSPALSEALESDRFRRFLDHVPLAIAVSELGGPEVIIYANAGFERVTGVRAAELEQQYWDRLDAVPVDEERGPTLLAAITDPGDQVYAFRMRVSDADCEDVELHSNVIEDDGGRPKYRLVALVNTAPFGAEAEALEARIREKDTLLRELQHRVKNNLQMITALIRLEARNAVSSGPQGFERLAGRVASLGLLYDALAGGGSQGEVDLGLYLGQIATAVMASHAVEGVRLDLSLDTFTVSINVAMPTGLVVNELLTNALKHAFVGREGGTITLQGLVDGDRCKIVVADDGVGLPEGETWPKRGRLGALIAESLKQNAKAELDVTSGADSGTAVTMTFSRTAASSE